MWSGSRFTPRRSVATRDARPREGYTGGVNEFSPEAFEDAIKETHGAKAQLLTLEPVIEKFEGKTVWEGEVLVFALKGHPTAKLCYAWEVDGKVTAVLHQGPVDSPLAAVRAAILSEESDG